MNGIPKTCLLCKHFHFDGGERGYSDMTPGTRWSSRCRLNHWEMSGCEVTTEEYRTNMLSANYCDDFVMSDEVGDG
jgi:hypothetical protein